VLVAICALGVSSIMTQLVLMRELLCIFSGNELVLGIVLGNWLLLTGAGSYLGKGASRLAHPIGVLFLAQLAVAVLPLVDVYLLRTLRNVVFVPGVQLGVLETALSSGILLLPYCLIAGYLLTLACCLLAPQHGASSIGQVYFVDNLGDIAGGLLFTVVVVYVSSHFHLLYLPAALNLVCALLVALAFRRVAGLALAGAATAVLLVTVALIDLDQLSFARQYAPERVAFHGQSPYGSLVVTESHGQYNFIESGVPLFSTHNVEQVEEMAHFAMAHRPEAKRVLLIAGGVAGTAQELLKYRVAAVDYVELDPLILAAARQYLPESLGDPRIHIQGGDGRLFVQQTAHRYGVVIADLPDPSTSQLNRFYTREFFQEVQRVLTPGGVFCLTLAHYENYVSRELADLLSVADRTLRSVFKRTRIIPGARLVLLASDGALDADISSELERHRIRTQHLNRSYLSHILSADRAGQVRRALSREAPLNRDLSPILYYRQLVYWTSQFNQKLGIVALAAGALLLVYLLRARAVGFAVFTTGCTASALQVVILLGFQAMHGCVYQRVGVLVTMFIVGLALGSFAMNRMLSGRRRKDLVLIELAIAAFAACVPLALLAAKWLSSGGGIGASLSADAVFPLLALLPGVLVGMEFPLAGKVDFAGVGETASRLYAADLVGASLGAMVVGAILLPLLGATAVCLLTAGLNLVSGGAVWLGGRG
jgi:spermidine synthase